jgi:hypothetical protein
MILTEALSGTLCEISSKKIKRQMISGIPGSVEMVYDRKIGRFFENNFNPL